MRIVVAMKVRNEADVIEANLRYHAALGVDFFVVTDNGSTDETPAVLRRWADAGRLHLISEPGSNFWVEAHGWVTRMARLAATDFGADWVLHADADEFWAPLSGTLEDAFGEVPDRYDVVMAPRPEFLARPETSEPFFERMTVRERYSRLRPKVAHRAAPDVALHQGGHDVDLADGKSAATARRDRAVVKLFDRDDAADDGRLVWSPHFPVRVLHFPLRSYDQYKRRVETVLFRGEPPRNAARKRLLEQYEAGMLPELYEQQVVADDALEAGLREGRLAVDESVRDVLRAAPPSPGEPASVPLRTTTDAERAEVQFDAMQTLARTQRILVRRLDRAQERSKKRKARVQSKAPAQGGNGERSGGRSRPRRLLSRAARALRRG